MTLTQLLLLASLLFCIGIYGVLTRRHAIALLLSLELMLNAANIAFVGLRADAGRRGGDGGRQCSRSSRWRSRWPRSRSDWR